MGFRRLAVLLLALGALPAEAIEPFTIKDIRVEGIQRTEAGTVFSYLPVKVGDTMTDDKAAQAIRALFATGFFKDVSLEADNGVLVVVVQERPSVAQVEFAGMREFDKDQVLKGLRQVGLAEGRIFDKGLLDRAEQELKRQYLSRGMYAVNINTTVTPLEGVEVGPAAWPETRECRTEGIPNPVWGHEGHVRGVVPLTFIGPQGSGDRTIDATLRFQACRGTECLPPSSLRVAVRVREAGLIGRPLPGGS